MQNISSPARVGYRTWVHGVIELPPLVHPHFSDASRIVEHHILNASRERVGRLVAKHVAHVRARHDLQPPAALPHLYPDFITFTQIFITFDPIFITFAPIFITFTPIFVTFTPMSMSFNPIKYLFGII